MDYLLEEPCEPDTMDIYCPECNQLAHLNINFKIQCDDCEKSFKYEPEFLEEDYDN